MLNKERYIPISIIAKRLNKSAQWVRDAIECGELEGVNLGLGKERPRWYVTEEIYQKFIKSRKVNDNE